MSAAPTISITLKVWRQPAPTAEGRFETHERKNVPTDMSFLEMMDELNNHLESQGQEPIAFDSDCREGICGACGLYINGRPHGPLKGTTTCQLHMRSFANGDTITVEPWRAKAFPVLKDLVVDRSAMDKVIQAGGYISAPIGSAPEANSVPVPRDDSEKAMDAAACIGCGACVAACRNASAMLFVSAKVSHLNLLPQGQPERISRTVNMVEAMDKQGFGACTNEAKCEAACPKDIKMENIGRLNREFIRAKILGVFTK